MPYNIGGSEYVLTAEPFVKDGKHYVPLRDVVETLGGSVAFDADTKETKATIADWVASVTPGDTAVDVSGQSVTLTAPPYIEDGILYVPYDFFHDAYGYTVSVAGDTVTITNPNA